MLHNEAFDLSLFRARIKNLQSCQESHNSKFYEKAERDGLRKEIVQYELSNKKYSADYFRRDVVSVLREQVSSASPSDIIWNPPPAGEGVIGTLQFGSHSNSHPLHSKYFRSEHSKRKKEVMGAPDANSVWYDDDRLKSFIGFLQVFTDKTVTTLKVGGIAAHVVHVTFLNFTKAFRRKLIHSGKTMVGFLPTRTTEVAECSSDSSHVPKSTELIVNDDDVELDVGYGKVSSVEEAEETDDKEIVALLDKVLLTSTSTGRGVKMGLIHATMTKMLQPLLDLTITGFKIPFGLCTWVCYPMFMSYCCDIPEAKDMSAVRHGLLTNCPCHRCLVSFPDITDLGRGEARHHRGSLETRDEIILRMEGSETGILCKTTGKRVTVSEQCKQMLQKLSLAPYPSFLENILRQQRLFLPSSLYDIFTYEPLHNLHLGISKLLKTLTYELIGSDKIVTFGTPKRPPRKMKFCTRRVPVLRACNSFLRVMKNDCSSASIHIDFSTKEESSRLNGIFLDSGMRGMLEGKDYRNLDYFFPFVAAFVDRITGCVTNGITTVHTMYSNLLEMIFTDVEDHGMNDRKAHDMDALVMDLKRECKDVFAEHVQKGLYTLKFHLLDHLAEDMARYGSLEFLNSGPYEFFNTVVKKHYRDTSKRKKTAIEETAKNLSTELHRLTLDGQALVASGTAVDQSDERNPRKQYLVRDGIIVNLREMKDLLREVNEMSQAVRSTLRTVVLSALPAFDLTVLTSLIDDHVKKMNFGVLDYDITITVVKSGYIEAFQTPSLSSFDASSCRVLYLPSDSVRKGRKRVFATAEFGPPKKKKHSTIFMRGESHGDQDEFWFAKVIVLFRMTCEEHRYSEEFALVRFYICTPPSDYIDDTLGCICLRWETEDGNDHSRTAVSENDSIEAGEQYGLIPFQSICGTCEVVRSNYAIHPFTQELPWTHHKFYVNRFLP